LPKASPPQLREKNGPERTERGRFASGNTGRPPGIPTKKTEEIKEIARKILLGDTPESYIKNVRQRILSGEAPHMEKFFGEHLWGKPRENISINITETHLIAVKAMSDMDLLAFLDALDAKQPERALALLPGQVA
jgi:hypothetical protein